MLLSNFGNENRGLRDFSEMNGMSPSSTNTSFQANCIQSLVYKKIDCYSNCYLPCSLLTKVKTKPWELLAVTFYKKIGMLVNCYKTLFS